jgi:hypothetical protein
MPKEQSMTRHPNGMWRRAPQIIASGMTRAHAINPAVNTQTFRRGSIHGPMKKTAMAMCANASQSVP